MTSAAFAALVLTVTTGHQGEYRAVALIPGEYDLTAERSGFTAVV